MSIVKIGIQRTLHFSPFSSKGLCLTGILTSRLKQGNSGFSTLKGPNPTSFYSISPNSRIILETFRHRQFSTSLSSTSCKYRGPRFNRSVPSSPFELLWYKIPSGLKTILAVTGLASFLVFVTLPFLVFVFPPLCIGSLILGRLYISRSKRNFAKQQKEMSKTSLRYDGNLLDIDYMRSFVMKRVIDAFEINEKNVLDLLNLNEGMLNQHHTLKSRFSLTSIETINQNFDFASLNLNDTHNINGTITTISFGLIDKDRRALDTRIATVVLSLKPYDVRNLVDISVGMECVMEIKPSANLKESVLINTPSDIFHHKGTVFEIKRKCT